MGKPKADLADLSGRKLKEGVVQDYTNNWVLRAIPGPNTSSDYATEAGMDLLFSRNSKIQHTSNRSAYRLNTMQGFK